MDFLIAMDGFHVIPDGFLFIDLFHSAMQITTSPTNKHNSKCLLSTKTRKRFRYMVVGTNLLSINHKSKLLMYQPNEK